MANKAEENYNVRLRDTESAQCSVIKDTSYHTEACSSRRFQMTWPFVIISYGTIGALVIGSRRKLEDKKL